MAVDPHLEVSSWHFGLNPDAGTSLVHQSVKWFEQEI